MADHFAAEPLIIQRIQSRNIAGLKTVGSASLIAGEHNAMRYLPAIFIMPGGGNLSPGADGRVQTETQFWQMSVCVGHIRDPDDLNTTAKKAGAIAAAALSALIGWRPSAEFKPMALVDRPEPYYEPGYAEFPFVLQTQLMAVGN